MMAIFRLITCILVTLPNCLLAQSPSKLDVGAYYSYLINSEFATTSGPIRFQEHYLNTHLRYRFARGWRGGVEYIMANYTGSSTLQNPYHVFGSFVDYDLIKRERIQLHLRTGLSTGSLLFKGDDLPQKRWVVNRIIGASMDIRLLPSVYVQFGYYNHYPLNSIRYKYGIAQPFLGGYVRL